MAEAKPRILLVDDEPDVLKVLRLILETKDYEIVAVSDGSEASRLLQTEHFDLLISDIVMEPMTGIELFHIAKRRQPDLPALMISGYATIDTSIDAIREGVFDCLTKPFPPAQFLFAVESALRFGSADRREAVDLLPPLGGSFYYANIVAENPKMRRVCDFIDRVAGMEVPILITGGRGTGKTLISKTIHAQGPRRRRDFVAVSCAGLPPSFFDSIFRSTGDASTRAPVGTVLLKEIGVMPIAIQDKLISVLEARAAAENAEQYNDVRILASTTTGLDSCLQDGSFRQSLHRYFSVISLVIPPLKERKEDILPLVSHFLRLKVGTDAALPSLSSKAHEALENYAWPGNVRELKETVEYAFATSDAKQIGLAELPQAIAGQAGSAAAATRPAAPAPGADPRGRFLKASFRTALSHMRSEEDEPATKPDDAPATKPDDEPPDPDKAAGSVWFSQ